jgi:hypothetical protein
MVQVIKVEPLGKAWALRQGAAEIPLVFQSGARAEDAAHALGERLAAEGRPAEIRIYLRDGALAGAFRLEAA